MFATSGSVGGLSDADDSRRHGDRGNRQDISWQSRASGGFRRVRRNFPGTDGLLHISEISEQRIRDVRDELKLGDQVLVKVLAIEGNKIRLSRKALLREAREKQKQAGGGDGGAAPAPAAVETEPAGGGEHE